MTDLETTTTPLPFFENIEIGDKPSRASGVVFFVICLIPIIATILYGGVDTGTWVLLPILTGVAILAWLSDAWFGKALLINRSWLLLPVAVLVLLGLIQILPLFGSGISNELLVIPATGTLSLDPYATRLFTVRLTVYLLFFAAALTFINTERRLKKVVYGIVMFAAVMAFFGILQRLANPEAIYGLRGTPQAIPFGPFVNQHHFASFMEMTGGIVFGLLFGDALRRDKKLLLAIAAVIMGVAVILTGSRGGLMSFTGALAFVAVAKFLTKKRNSSGEKRSNPSKMMAVFAATLGAAIVIFGIVLLLGGDNSLMRGVGMTGIQDDISNGRTHFWSVAVRIFFDHPILGAGLDAFGVAFPQYDKWVGIFRVEQAHNDYLQTLSDAGIVGLICVVSFIFLLFRKGLRLISTSTDAFRISAATGALAGCFGILIHSFFDFPLRTPSNAFFFLLLVVIATVSVKASVPQRSRRN